MNYLDCYTRVSTTEQKKTGNSLVVQRDIGKKVAKKLGLKFRHRDEGSRSSTIHYRDVLEQLKDDIEKGLVKNIWCQDRSRMFRDMTDGLLFRRDFIEKYDVTVYEGELPTQIDFNNEDESVMYDIITRLQQYENKKRIEKSQRGKVAKLKDAVASNKSVYLGGSALFGYKNVDKEWQLNKEEVKWVKWMFQAYEDGKSTKDIKNHLDKNNVPTRRTESGLWNMVTIQKMLSNKTYTGIHTVYIKKIDRKFSFKVDKIITVSQFNRVQKTLNANQKNKDNNKKHDALLDGFLVCECGNAMGSKHQKYIKKTGISVDQKKYFCREKEYQWRRSEESRCVNSKALDMRETDSFITNTIKKIVKDSSLLKQHTKEAVLKEKNRVEDDFIEERNKIEGKVQRIQKSIDNIENQIVELEVKRVMEGLGENSKEERIVLKVIQRYEQELEKQHEEYKLCEKALSVLDKELVWVDWVGKFSDELDAKTRKFEDRQEFLKGVIDKIIVSAEFTMNRDEKKVQHGHSFKIMFNMKIVGDKLIYTDETKKTLGYKIKEGKNSHETGLVYDVTARAGRKKVKKKAGETQ